MVDIHSAQAVFVPGTFPSLTYNDRLSTDLKEKVTKYLVKGAGDCLVISGASKTGKTVLVERWLAPDAAIWIKGDEIQSVDDLYRRIIDDLGLFAETAVDHSASGTVAVETGLAAGIASILRWRMNVKATAQVEEGVTHRRVAMNVSVVKNALRTKPVPIVIDDFHFLEQELRVEVAKAVKDLARLARVVLIAIPHAAFQPLKKLEDLDWRVRSLNVKRWEKEELKQIATEGFALLGVVDHGGKVSERLALESRGAPAIMQALCLEYVTEVADVWATAVPAVDASEPQDWAAFLRDVASERKPSAFDALLVGKKTRGNNRTVRYLTTGQATDIYGAVLFTIREMGVVSETTKNEIARKMSEIIRDAPQPQTVSGTLGHLAAIAEEVRGQSDPALTYDDPNLHILDPFLAFYLNHGDWKLPEPVKASEPADDSSAGGGDD